MAALALAAAIPAAGASAFSLAIEHAAISCVPIDRYARVTARAAGAAPIAGAELQFRIDAGSAWYSVRMAAEDGGEWAAYLPRPTRALRQLDYRVVMTAPDAASAATDPVTVRVVDSAECDSQARSSLPSSIVVAVPAGAPVVPPVPAGLSPAGVVAAEGPPPSKTGRRIAGAVVGAAVATATAVAFVGSSAGSYGGRPAVPEFSFNGTSPRPGSVLGPERDPLVILMVMNRQPDVPLSVLWRAELRSGVPARLCLTMDGNLFVAQGPLEVAFTGPLIASGACGARFDVDSLHMTIEYLDRTIYDQTHALPFTFER